MDEGFKMSFISPDFFEIIKFVRVVVLEKITYYSELSLLNL